MNEESELLDGLPVLQRLALSYAPTDVRRSTLALLALDTRLAGIVRAASEPMLAQIRLAWWREQLSVDAPSVPAGEPLLAILQTWGSGRKALVGLVNAWEEITGAPPLPITALEKLAYARGRAFADLAEQISGSAERDAALRLGRNWALADIAARLSQPDERRAVRELAEAQDWSTVRLSRKMRPLVMLHGLAARAIRRGEALDEMPPSAMIAALRLGLLGR